MNEEIRLEVIGITYNQIESGVYALILQEEGSHRRIPIIIGYNEAQTIECRLQNITPPRPLTHDMAAAILEATGATLTKVMVRKLPNGVFAADMTIESAAGTAVIDARSSDAIATAIRTGTPIFTTREVLDEAGFDAGEETRSRQGSPRNTVAGPGNPASPGTRRTRAQIEEAIHRASEREDYEEAARLKRELDEME